MDTNTSLIIEILSSLLGNWEYAPLIREKIESGALSSGEIADLADILWNGIQSIENENSRIEMENILFRRFLTQTEEAGTRKAESATIEDLLVTL